MIDGVTVIIAEKEYVIPPLNFAGTRKYIAASKRLSGIADPEEQMSIMAEMVWLALKRNYPQLSVEDVEDILDFTNVQTIMDAIVEASGLKKNMAMTTPETASGTLFTVT